MPDIIDSDTCQWLTTCSSDHVSVLGAAVEQIVNGLSAYCCNSDDNAVKTISCWLLVGNFNCFHFTEGRRKVELNNRWDSLLLT